MNDFVINFKKTLKKKSAGLSIHIPAVCAKIIKIIERDGIRYHESSKKFLDSSAAPDDRDCVRWIYRKYGIRRQGLSWLNYGQSFGLMDPVVLDLGILVITFGLSIRVTMASIIGVVIALIAYRLI